jgi:DNA-binding transcriptional ArsR family regulator
MVWAVLEEVALDARPTGDHLVARTNVRRLATGLGISKDTAARALARLGDAGLVSRQNTRRQTGRFMAWSYVVRLDETSGIAVLADDSCPMDPRPATPDTAARGDGDAPPSSARRSSRPRSSRRRRAAEQSCLFPLSDQREDGQ